MSDNSAKGRHAKKLSTVNQISPKIWLFFCLFMKNPQIFLDRFFDSCENQTNDQIGQRFFTKVTLSFATSTPKGFPDSLHSVILLIEVTFQFERSSMYFMRLAIHHVYLHASCVFRISVVSLFAIALIIWVNTIRHCGLSLLVSTP